LTIIPFQTKTIVYDSSNKRFIYAQELGRSRYGILNLAP